MLRVIRRYRGSTLEKILFGLLAALFVIWGVGSFGGARVDVVARVHGETITRRDLDHATALLQRRYEEMMKGQFSAEMARSLRDVAVRGLPLPDDFVAKEIAAEDLITQHFQVMTDVWC